MIEKGPDKEQVRALGVLATVSSLGAMVVIDFLIAYYAGNWLDKYFETGDHTWRIRCIGIAMAMVCYTFFKMIHTVMNRSDDE